MTVLFHDQIEHPGKDLGRWYSCATRMYLISLEKVVETGQSCCSRR